MARSESWKRVPDLVLRQVITALVGAHVRKSRLKPFRNVRFSPAFSLRNGFAVGLFILTFYAYY